MLKFLYQLLILSNKFPFNQSITKQKHYEKIKRYHISIAAYG